MKNSLAATSIARPMSVPSFCPDASTASAIRSSAARLESRLGAKPPSSPRPVESPFFFSTDLSAW